MRVFNTDEILTLNDKELNDMFFAVRSEINKKKKQQRKGSDIKELEIYYCYLYREIEQRSNYVKNKSA